MIRMTLSNSGRIKLHGSIPLPLPASVAWGQMRAFAHFIRLDPFHARVDLLDEKPRVGSRLAIGHRFGPFRVRRTGRILRWNEGVGFSFSDLSLRGRQVGFPHIFTYTLTPIDEQSSRLDVIVHGRWTAPLLPRWAVRAWLWWVLSRTLDSVRDHLLMQAIDRAMWSRAEPT